MTKRKALQAVGELAEAMDDNIEMGLPPEVYEKVAMMADAIEVHLRTSGVEKVTPEVLVSVSVGACMAAALANSPFNPSHPNMILSLALEEMGRNLLGDLISGEQPLPEVGDVAVPDVLPDDFK